MMEHQLAQLPAALHQAGMIEPRAARTPAALLQYQIDWVDDQAQVKVIEKSRRIGLSWAEAADCTLLAASQRGMDVWYIGYMKEMAEEFIRDCADWARHFNQAAGEIETVEEVFIDGEEKQSILTYVIRFASGWRITALSSSPRNLRGKQGRVVIDEAAFHDKLGELLKAALALLIWGGQVHVISTHDGAENAFNDLCNDIRAGKAPYSLHRVTFREAVEQGLYDRVCLRTGKTPTEADQAAWVDGIYKQYRDNADEELDCIPRNSGGAWISRALIEARMVDTPVLRWKPPAGFAQWPQHLREAECQDWLDKNVKPLLARLDPALRSGFGMDFGRLGDLSVIDPFQVLTNLTRHFPFSVELSDVPFEQQRQILFYIADRLPRLYAGNLDARGNGHYLAEVAMQRYGATRIEQVMLSLAWYREHTAPFKAAFEDATIEIPRDADQLDDLRAMEVVKGVPQLPDTRRTGKSGTSRHGDSAISKLLAYDASLREPIDIEFQTTGRPRVATGMADFTEM
jgi:phage FluMu gp28-like protein